MRFKNITGLAALATMIATPALASAAPNPAAPLSLSGSSVRTGSSSSRASHLEGGAMFAAIGALGIGAAAVILAATAPKGHRSVSP